MGVKSTVCLTRQEAEGLFADLHRELRSDRYGTVEASAFSDGDLEAMLERWNDEAGGGEGGANYRIVGAGAGD